MAECRTCELVERRDRGEAPLWDSILRTPSWDLVHGDEVALEGWLIIVCRRHVASLAQLSGAEASELGRLVQRASAALHEVVGCAKTYVAQFAEHPLHQHVHVHVIPRASDLAPEFTGPRIFNLLAGGKGAVSEPRMDAIATGIRRHLES